MATKPLISIVGSLNIDFVTVSSRVPGPGETVTAKSLQVNAGGKGANQAVACGKASFVSEESQDVEVEMVGAVGAGDPYYASLLRPTLERSGVSTSAIREAEGSQTGTATILVEETGDNRILVVPGANHDAMQDAELLHQLVTQRRKPDVLVMQGEIPRQTVLGLLESFSSTVTCIYNPAPVYPEGIPAEILHHIDYLVMNESESLLLGKSVSATAAQMHDDDANLIDKLEAISGEFHKIGIDHVIVTLGAKGVLYHNKGIPRAEIVPGVRVARAVDTTAAGDTFVGYFAVALARHVGRNGSIESFDMESAITRANAAAAMCVQKEGAMQSIPFNYEIV